MYVLCQCQKCATIAHNLQVIKTETSEFNLGYFTMTLHNCYNSNMCYKEDDSAIIIMYNM
jgi:hypothetical protein